MHLFDFVRTIFEKVGVLYFASTCLLTTMAILFLPIEILDQIMLSEVKNEWGKFIGLVFILSIAYLTIAIVGYVHRYINKIWYGHKFKAIIIDKLHNLNSDELRIIGTFYDMRSEQLRDIADLDYCDGTVKNLINKGVIIGMAVTVPASYSDDYRRLSAFIPCMLSKTAKEYLSVENGTLLIKK